MQTIARQQAGNISVPKNTIINIRVDNDLKKQAKKLAADENRSLSNWVTWLIRREIKRKDGKR